MATAGEMIKVIAGALARPQATVTSYYAALRKAGFISTTGRGKSAQDLTALDTARILIVMLSADSLNEAEAITDLVGDLAHAVGSEEEGITDWMIFAEAMASVIQYKADRIQNRTPCDTSLLGNLENTKIEISVTATHLTANIKVNGSPFIFSNFHDTPPVTYPDEWSEIPVRDRLLLRAMMEGMAVTRTITDGALNLIARAMP